jgi:probable rRNA maturation factor
MIHRVNILNELNDERNFQEIDQVIFATLTYLSAPPGDMSLVLTDNATIQKMNKQFMDIDKPTDVLSFPDGDTDQETGRVYFGDVMIAVPYAEKQALESGNSLADEIALLSIHGVLHLFGFLHSDPEDRQKMWSIQDDILKQIGCEIESPRYQL